MAKGLCVTRDTIMIAYHEVLIFPAFFRPQRKHCRSWLPFFFDKFKLIMIVFMHSCNFLWIGFSPNLSSRSLWKYGKRCILRAVKSPGSIKAKIRSICFSSNNKSLQTITTTTLRDYKYILRYCKSVLTRSLIYNVILGF